MASGFFKCSSRDNWFFPKNEKEEPTCTDGWHSPYACFDENFEHPEDTFQNPRLLMPINLVKFNNDGE